MKNTNKQNPFSHHASEAVFNALVGAGIRRNVMRAWGFSLLFFCTSAYHSFAATYTVNFDGAGETKLSYASGNVTLSGISWNLSGALIGTSAGSDRFNGIRSARIQATGIMTMLADKMGGVGTITLNHAKYGGDANSSWMLEVSNDGGASWTAYTSTTIATSTTTLTSQSFTVNVPDNAPFGIRIRISKLTTASTTNRLSIDDIVITDYTPGNTTTCGAITSSAPPFCITNVVGATANVAFTSVGTYGATNDYTAELSDASGSFLIPTNIGTLSSFANSGSIPVTIPAGTPSGNGYKIRITSSSPIALTTTASAIFSIYLNTPEVTGLTSASGNTQVTVSWTNPTGCFDQVMIVAQPLTSVIATPSGTTYTANSVFGSGTAFGTGYVVYYGTGTSVTVTGLTNGTVYYFKAFVVKSGIWSNGIEISDIPNPFLTGDYRTINSGCWADPLIWQTFNGVSWVAAGSPPNNAATNVTVAHNVIVSTTISPVSVKDLIVNSGGKIYASNLVVAGTPSGCGYGNFPVTNIYIGVYGTNLQVNGTGQIGNGYQFDWLGINIEGANVTLSGTNSATTAFNVSRLRKSFLTNTVTNLTITLPRVNLWWNSVSGTSLYNNSGGTFNLTVDVNATVTTVVTVVGFSGNASINGVAGNGNGAGVHGDGTFTVNGTLNIPGILYGFTQCAVLGKSCNWIVGTTGILRCNLIQCGPAPFTGSGAAGNSITVLNGGRLILDNNNNVSLTDPFTNWSTVNNTYTLQPGSIVEYANNAPSAAGNTQVVNPNLIYSNLVISGTNDKTVAANLTVNRDLTILAGSLQPGANTIFLGGDWNNYGTAGFLEATSKVVFQGTATQTIYCAGGENYYNVDISNSVGVQLSADISVAKILDMTATGKLIYGPSQHNVTLSDMSAGAVDLVGSGSAYIDLTGSNHYLYIGSYSTAYTGGFNAGTQSFVVYYRNNAINLLPLGGDQLVMMNIAYANLSLIGTDNKYTNDNFSVNVNLSVDGPTTIMHATTTGKTVTLGGNLVLSGGAIMSTDCRDNLSILTQGNINQVFDANFQTVECYDLLSTKSAGGITLASGQTTVDAKNDMRIDYTGSAVLTDNTNTIKVGDDVEIGNALANFNFTGTLEFTGIGANGDVHLSDLTGTGKAPADLNNLTINTGAQTGILKIVEIMPASGAQTIVIKGNVTIVQGTNGGEMDANANNLNVGGNWTTYDETGFDEAGSTVMFNGTVLQTIFATAFEQFDFLKINNTSAGVQLLGAVKSNNLNLTLGQLDLNFYRLTITNPLSTAVVGGSNNSYVKSETALGGPLLATNPSIMQWNMDVSTGNFVFPFGVSGTYIPLTFNKLVNTSANIEIATRATTPDNKPWDDITNVPAVTNMLSGSVGGDGSVDVVIDRWWDINASSSGIFADITFTYRGVENTLTGGYATGALAAQNWDGTIWLPPVCSFCNNGVLAGTGTVVVASALVGNTPWVISNQVAPLPIELLDFAGERDGNDVLLHWVTSSEKNNDYFEVLSALQSASANDFVPIGRVKGHGSSTVNNYYSFADKRADKNGTYYYQLKQVDYDGKSSFSKIIAVNFTKGELINLIGIMPNPFREQTSVQLYAAQAGMLQVKITNVLGQQITSEFYSIEKGFFTFNPERTVRLNAGVYFVELVFDKQRMVLRMVKQ